MMNGTLPWHEEKGRVPFRVMRYTLHIVRIFFSPEGRGHLLATEPTSKPSNKTP